MVSQSFTESKYRALSSTTFKVLWIQSLLNELHISNSIFLVLYYNNLSAKALYQNLIYHTRTKHIKID